MTKQEPFWPGGCLGGVSLAFDDGLQSQLTYAVPLLNEHELQATFYLCPAGPPSLTRWIPWRSVAAAGHELGSHTMTHPSSIPDSLHPSEHAGDKMTLDDIAKELVESKLRLQRLAPGQKDMSFAYPSFCNHVGVGGSRQDYSPIVAGLYVAGRGLGRAPRVNDPATACLPCLKSQPGGGMTAGELIELVESHVPYQCWIILVFHDIHEGRGRIGTLDSLRGLFRHLATHRHRIWTAPVATIARRIVRCRAESELVPA